MPGCLGSASLAGSNGSRVASLMAGDPGSPLEMTA